MTFKRDSELNHWKDDPVKSITILKKYVVDGRDVNTFEIRQYTHKCSYQRYHTVYTIYLETNDSKIETKYNQGTQMSENDIESIAQCITNFNGVYSTINRLLLELDDNS
ncbi:MAG TPA: hypothetical protein VIA09_04300 [Nitrososphaeraceae archaeon]|jgi:hypothetical protein